MLEILTEACECHDNQWMTQLDVINNNDSFYEVNITGRGHCFHAMIGIHKHGGFLCIPALQFGCQLSYFSDLFYNRERIMRSIDDPYIAETLARAISLLSELRN